MKGRSRQRTGSTGGGARSARGWGPVVLACACMVPSVGRAVGPVPGMASPSSAAGDGEPGDASAPTRVVVLPARVAGGLPPSTAVEVQTLVLDELVADELTVLRAEASPSECDVACRSAAARAAQADYVAQAEVEGDEDEFEVAVVLYGADGQPLAPFESACSICGLVEVRDMVRLATLDARTEVLRRRRADAPASDVGAVEPTPPAAPPVIARSRLVPAGWGLGGAGAVATIGGAVLLGLHHRSAGCLDNPRGGDCVPLRYTTAIPGAVVLGTGVVAVVSGVVMVVLGRRAERRQVERALAVRPAGLGLRVRF